MALHVLLAWDGGRVVRSVAPGVGPWLGPVCWAAYGLFAIGSVAIVGLGRTGLARAARRRIVAPRPCAHRRRAPLPPVRGQHLTVRRGAAPRHRRAAHRPQRGALLPRRPAAAAASAGLAAGRALVLDRVRRVAPGNVVAGAYPPFVAMQVAATTAGGVALAAIRLRSGSLWPVLATHAALDVIAIATLTGPATTSPILVPGTGRVAVGQPRAVAVRLAAPRRSGRCCARPPGCRDDRRCGRLGQPTDRCIGTPVSRQTVVNSIDSPTAAAAVARSTTS